MLTFRAQDLSGKLPASQHDLVAQNVHSAANLRLAGGAQKAKRGTTVDTRAFTKAARSVLVCTGTLSSPSRPTATQVCQPQLPRPNGALLTIT